MKAIRHTETLYYYDGPQVFEARDAIGGHYIAVMVEPDGGQDQYLVAEVEPERLQQFRMGTLDLRSLLTERGDKEWFLAKVNGSLDAPLALQPQPTALAASSYLPEPGFLLHNSPANGDSLANHAGLDCGSALGVLKEEYAHPSKSKMTKFSLPLSRLIHENLSIVMCFAYSRKPLHQMLEANFSGGWNYLEKALFRIPEERAEKACLELAMFLRMLDDEEKISDYHAATRNIPDCGKLIMKNKPDGPLRFRDVANKIIHSSRLEWDFSRAPNPLLISHSRDGEKWLRAEVDVVALAEVCGQLMS